MPPMEKLGLASSRTTVTSAAGSSSRARRAALIPASLPPIMTRCMAGLPLVVCSTRLDRTGRLVRRRRGAVMCGPGGRTSGLFVVGNDDVGGVGWRDGGVYHLDDRYGYDAAEDLRGDEGQHRGRRDAREGV